MPVDFEWLSQPLWLQIFPLALLVYFLVVRQRLRWWHFTLPVLTSLLLLGPAIRFASSMPLRAIRVDTTASLQLVEPSLIEKTIEDLKIATGLSDKVVLNFEGESYFEKKNFSPWHRPPRLPGEILLTDVFYNETQGVIRLPATRPAEAILTAEIPAHCYREEECVFSVFGIVPKPRRLLLEINGEVKTSVLVTPPRFQVKLSYRFKKAGNFAGKLRLAGTTSLLGLAEFPFLLVVKEALPRGAFVFERPSLATWQIARYLAKFESFEIEAISPQKVNPNVYDFIIYYSGNIKKSDKPLFDAAPLVREFSERNIFEENEFLESKLQSFLFSIMTNQDTFSSLATAVGQKLCATKLIVKTAQGEVLPCNPTQEGQVCCELSQVGKFYVGDLLFEVGISLEERLSLNQPSLPMTDIALAIAEAHANSWQNTLISFSLATGKLRPLIDVIFLASYLAFVFFVWYRWG